MQQNTYRFEKAACDQGDTASAFYDLDDDEKSLCLTALANRALEEWGITDATLCLIKQRENAVFAVTRRDGTQSALRIHRAGYHSDPALLSELQWMKSLDTFGVRTPPVVPANDGALFKRVTVPEVPEPRQVDVLGWVDGTAIGSIEEGVADVVTAQANYRRVGRLVARMHRFARQWQPPVGFTRHAWDEAGLVGERPWWGRFWELDALNNIQREQLQFAREKAASELAEYGKQPDRYGLIHADPLPENFLVEGDDTVRVIDFDDGGYGWLMFDFATALFFHLGETYFDKLLVAMKAGYQEDLPLPPQFEEKLPLFLMLRGFTYLGWVHTRKETDTAKEMTPALVEGVITLVQEYLGN